MSHQRRYYATFICLVAIAHPLSAKSIEMAMLLEVNINGHSNGKIGEFILSDGKLFSKAKELRTLGFRVSNDANKMPEQLIELASIKGISWRLDTAKQQLYATTQNDNLVPTQLSAETDDIRPAPIESSLGATLNYDFSGTSIGGQNTASGLFDLRAFSPWGVASTDGIGYAGGGSGRPGTNTAIRLDSVYTFSNPETLHRYRVGDFITGSLGWTRAVRMGGVQISSDFSIRPDLVTFPLPSISGAVAVPSTVDILANGSRLFSQQVEAGPFEIPHLPVVTGANNISMTLTNALGRQVTVSLPFYASAALLSPGLQSFSAQVGAVRRNWGSLSNDYGNPAAFATYRRGISSMVTIEGSTEATAGTAVAGGGVAINIGNVALLSAAASGSAGSGATGTQFSLGIQRIGQMVSAGVSATMADRRYLDVAGANGDPVPRTQLRANATLSMGRFGALGIAYTAIDRDRAQRAIKLYIPQATALGQDFSLTGGTSYLQPAQHAHVASVSYSLQIYNASFYATGFRDFSSQGGTGILVGITLPFGSRSSAGVSGGAGSDGSYQQFQAQQSAPQIGDWGYQAFGATGKIDHEFAQLQYKSPWSLLTAGIDRIGTQTSTRLETEGALSTMDGRFFPSNKINDSFAVVSTDGLAGVRVMQENRDVGRTGPSGRLLVPDLRSFDHNRLSIDPTDIPADATLATTTRDVRPQDRSGIVVRFPIKVSRAAVVQLVGHDGHPLPVGSVATLGSTGAGYPIGYDGKAYIEDLSSTNQVSVEQPNEHRCSVAFSYAPLPGDIPTIGPLQCLEKQP